MIDYSDIESIVGLNWTELDPNLSAAVDRYAASEDRDWAQAKVYELGGMVGGRIARNAEIIDANPPQVVRYDKWAHEINAVEHHPAALDTKKLLWDFGYTSAFHNDTVRRGRPTPSVVRTASDYLLSQADTGMVCSNGMTVGVAMLVSRYAPEDVRDEMLAKLNAEEFEDGADGSMFLTERDGGSDLGRTVHCVAKDIGDGRVLISGEKWFCSNADGAAIVMLARPEGAPEGTKGIGLYLVPNKRPDGSPNGIHIRRLKDKLGTKSVPTAEIEFTDALGYALRPHARASDGGSSASDVGGLNRMMEMVNGSRVGVAMMGLGIARRSFLEAAIWAHHRAAKGRLLIDLPLVRQQLLDLLVDVEASFSLGFLVGSIEGDDEVPATLRRVVTPAAKARLCRLGVDAASYAVDLYGGNGYCEDWHLTRQLRDAFAHPIWEGTENICRLDTLRVARNPEMFDVLLGYVASSVERTRTAGFEFTKPAQEATLRAHDTLARRAAEVRDADAEHAQVMSAPLTDLLASTVSAALLLEESIGDARKGLVATRYTQRHLNGNGSADWDASIALDLGREIVAYEEIDEKDAAATTSMAA